MGRYESRECWSAHIPWGHCVDSDSLRSVLQSSRFGEACDAVLGRDVCNGTGCTDEASHGAGIHNGAFPPLHHLGDFVFHAKPHSCQVRCHNVGPILFARVYDTHYWTHQSSIVEGKVQSAILSDRSRDHSLNVSRFSHIDF
jgi:hypothetical protein